MSHATTPALLALLLGGGIAGLGGLAGCIGGGQVDAMEHRPDSGLPGDADGDGGGGGGDGGAQPTNYDQLDRARAQAKFPDTTALMRYVIAPGCAAERNECHFNEDFPDLSSEGNLLNLLELPCNQQVGERTTIEEFCERVGDELRISAGANAGFQARVGSITAITSATGAFQAWEVRLERGPTAAQSNATFQLLRAGTALPALGAGSSLQVSAGQATVRITREADLPDPAQVRQGDENQDGHFGAGTGFLVAAGRARDSYLVRRLLGQDTARQRMPLTLNADTVNEANRPLTPDEMYALMSWINCLQPGDGPYSPIRYDCPENQSNTGGW
ncbi:MAG: hypothetical protein IT370_13290 [Deltaproteobacteria bacterium]|nr:hypothetical protein [Deltaproteobacteria bacterium]